MSAYLPETERAASTAVSGYEDGRMSRHGRRRPPHEPRSGSLHLLMALLLVASRQRRPTATTTGASMP